jgi:hypothetical protein
MAWAHTTKICWKVEPNGDVTFYAATYHLISSPVGGIIIDGVTHNFTSVVTPFGVPADVTCQEKNCDSFLTNIRHQVVTVPGLTSGEHWVSTTSTGHNDAPWPECYPTTINLDTKKAVRIDFKPEGNPNCADPASGGTVSVAIFGTAELDVRDVNAATLNFAGAAVKRWSYEDAVSEGPDPLMFWPPDGVEDLVAKFDTSQMTFPAAGSNCAEVELNGELFDGTPIVGRDWICLAGEPNCETSAPTMPPQ